MPEYPDWTAPQLAQPSRVGPIELECTELGHNYQQSLVSAGHTARIAGLIASFDANPPTYGDIRGPIVCNLYDHTSGDILASVGVSPARPVDRHFFEAGSGPSTTGTDIDIFTYAAVGFGTQFVNVFLYFYVQ